MTLKVLATQTVLWFYDDSMVILWVYDPVSLWFRPEWQEDFTRDSYTQSKNHTQYGALAVETYGSGYMNQYELFQRSQYPFKKLNNNHSSKKSNNENTFKKEILLFSLTSGHEFSGKLLASHWEWYLDLHFQNKRIISFDHPEKQNP